MYPPSPRVVAGLLLMAALDARAEPDTGLLVRVRVTNVAYVGRSLPVPDDRPWVHLNVEDWRDSVHSAEPQRLPPIGEVL